MRKLAIFASAVLLTGAAVQARAADANANAAADSDFTPLLSGLQKAWNDGDGAAWGAEFASDADSIGTAGVPVHGAKMIADRHAAVFAGPLKGSVMMITLQKSRMLGANDAVIDTVQTVKLGAHPTAAQVSGPGAMPGGGTTVHVSMVVERHDGKWVVVHAQNTVYDPKHGLLPPPKNS